MTTIKNLATVSKEEQIQFLNSFDCVLSDLDGVVWLNLVPIPGVSSCMKNLKKLGKKVHYISNNGVTPPDIILSSLRTAGHDLEDDDLVLPSHVMIHYLKKSNFDKKLFVISMRPLKENLRKSGFNLISDLPVSVEESVDTLLNFNEGQSDVGAVILDNDLNMNNLKLQKAFWYLRDPDCMFLITHRDKLAPFGPKGPILGTYHYIETLKDLTGKDFIEMGKPSANCINYIKDKYDITDTKRVLFVGDSIQSDMKAGATGGFKKLLVLSGNEKIEDLINWSYSEPLKPDYYIQDLSVLNQIIEKAFNFNK